MCGNGEGAEGGDDGVLTFEGGDERVEGFVVDFGDGDGGGEGVGAGGAGQDGDFEAGVEELVKDGRTKVAGGLWGKHVSMERSCERFDRVMRQVYTEGLCLPQPKLLWRCWSC